MCLVCSAKLDLSLWQLGKRVMTPPLRLSLKSPEERYSTRLHFLSCRLPAEYPQAKSLSLTSVPNVLPMSWPV
jgi:hypothetical protein